MLHHAVILPSDPSRLFKTFGSQRLYGSIQVGIQSRISGRAPSSNKGIVKEGILPTYMAIDCASIFLWLNDNAVTWKNDDVSVWRPRLWRREPGWLPVQRFCSQFG